MDVGFSCQADYHGVVAEARASRGKGCGHRWHLDTASAGLAEAQVYLRKPDPALASKYLDATSRYLRMYNELIGPYPYKKFALVENFWETGFGMPSFTLLGPKIIETAKAHAAAVLASNAVVAVLGEAAEVFALAGDVSGLVGARALIGAGSAVCLMAPLKAIATWYPGEKQASLAGWMMVAGGLGALAQILQRN